jgi:hypothetical protein
MAARPFSLVGKRPIVMSRCAQSSGARSGIAEKTGGQPTENGQSRCIPRPETRGVRARWMEAESDQSVGDTGEPLLTVGRRLDGEVNCHIPQE